MAIGKGALVGSFLIASVAVATAAPAVVTGDLNLRAGPGTGYGVMTVLPAGATVDAWRCSGNWCRVDYAGYSGFASASYLDIGGYAAAPPPAVYVGPRILRPRVYWGGPRWRHHRHHHWRHRHWRHRHRW
jgi:hypothetical protein